MAAAPAGRLLQRLSPLFEGPGVVHGRLEVGGIPELDVHANMVRQTAHKELGALGRGDARRVACQGLEAIGVVLHRRCEW